MMASNTKGIVIYYPLSLLIPICCISFQFYTLYSLLLKKSSQLDSFDDSVVCAKRGLLIIKQLKQSTQNLSNEQYFNLLRLVCRSAQLAFLGFSHNFLKFFIYIYEEDIALL